MNHPAYAEVNRLHHQSLSKAAGGDLVGAIVDSQAAFDLFHGPQHPQNPQLAEEERWSVDPLQLLMQCVLSAEQARFRASLAMHVQSPDHRERLMAEALFQSDSALERANGAKGAILRSNQQAAGLSLHLPPETYEGHFGTTYAEAGRTNTALGAVVLGHLHANASSLFEDASRFFTIGHEAVKVVDPSRAAIIALFGLRNAIFLDASQETIDRWRENFNADMAMFRPSQQEIDEARRTRQVIAHLGMPADDPNRLIVEDIISRGANASILDTMAAEIIAWAITHDKDAAHDDVIRRP